MHLIMPMGGAGTRFFNNGYDCPKPLLLLQGKPFFYWSARSVLSCCQVESLTFVVLQEHIDRFDIDKRILEYFPQAKIVSLPKVLPGAVPNLERSNPLAMSSCTCSGLIRSSSLRPPR